MNSASLAGQRHQRAVHLVGREDLAPDVGFRFLSHRRPRVGVDRVGTRHGFGGIREEPQSRAVARELVACSTT